MPRSPESEGTIGARPIIRGPGVKTRRGRAMLGVSRRVVGTLVAAATILLLMTSAVSAADPDSTRPSVASGAGAVEVTWVLVFAGGALASLRYMKRRARL